MNTRLIVRGACAAALVLAAAACGTDAPDAPGAAGAGAGAAAAAPAGAEAASAPSGGLSAGDSVEFVATEFAFAPSEVMAEAGMYSGALVNSGTIEHDITFDNGEAVVAGAGETVEFEFEVPEEGVRYWCSIPGHEDAGMAGIINTAASASAAEETAAPMEGHGAVGDAATTVEADPDAPPTNTAIRGRLLEGRAKASR